MFNLMCGPGGESNWVNVEENLPKIIAYGQTGLLVVDGRGISAEHSSMLLLPNQAI